jgi:hypothetical protein
VGSQCAKSGAYLPQTAADLWEIPKTAIRTQQRDDIGGAQKARLHFFLVVLPDRESESAEIRRGGLQQAALSPLLPQRGGRLACPKFLVQVLWE